MEIIRDTTHVIHSNYETHIKHKKMTQMISFAKYNSWFGNITYENFIRPKQSYLQLVHKMFQIRSGLEIHNECSSVKPNAGQFVSSILIVSKLTLKIWGKELIGQSQIYL